MASRPVAFVRMATSTTGRPGRPTIAPAPAPAPAPARGRRRTRWATEAQQPNARGERRCRRSWLSAAPIARLLSGAADRTTAVTQPRGGPAAHEPHTALYYTK